MIIPKGMTEKEVLECIDHVVKGLAPKYVFGYYTLEDIKQYGRLKAIELIKSGKFDSEKSSLKTFVWTHVKNRLVNLKRDEFERLDKPCYKCPLYKPNIKSECEKYEDKHNCDLYSKWYSRNESKKNVICPIDIDNVSYDKEQNLSHSNDLDLSIDTKDMVDLIDSKISNKNRSYWIKLKSDIKLSKKEYNAVLEEIREILYEDNYE